MTTPSFRMPVADKYGNASRELMQWLQQGRDEPLGILFVTADETVPSIPLHGTILWQSTSLGKTYIVHYDGDHKYFWEATGTDLY